MQRFEIVIVAPTWEDRQTLELLEAPRENDTIETRYGTCIVTSVEPAEGGHPGRVVCRLP